MKSICLLLCVIVSCPALHGSDEQSLTVTKSSQETTDSVLRGVMVHGVLQGKPTELWCYARVSSCSIPEPGEYSMAPATGDEAIYTDCSNVALYSVKKGKVGVYCWLGGPGCLPCGSPSKVEIDPAKISDEVPLKNDSAPKRISKGFQANGSIGSPLPAIFVPVLAELKGKTSIPVLLPVELPRPFGDAKHATVNKATRDEYRVALYYELDVGDAGFAAFFAASSSSPYSPRELGNVHEMKLTSGIVGFFRPVSCGGSCAPANLWWEQGGTLCQIQLKLPSTLGEKKQQRIITAVANSAIQAGPR